ncbi:unnamed protein product, partial [Prorocentrum cordatum]
DGEWIAGVVTAACGPELKVLSFGRFFKGLVLDRDSACLMQRPEAPLLDELPLGLSAGRSGGGSASLPPALQGEPSPDRAAAAETPAGCPGLEQLQGAGQRSRSCSRNGFGAVHTDGSRRCILEEVWDARQPVGWLAAGAAHASRLQNAATSPSAGSSSSRCRGSSSPGPGVEPSAAPPAASAARLKLSRRAARRGLGRSVSCDSLVSGGVLLAGGLRYSLEASLGSRQEA